MQGQTAMNLKILLPYQIFAEITNVSSIVAETNSGSFGLLPHRLECVAILTPGILSYVTEAENEVFLAVDEGVLVKSGMNVIISSRNAIGGTDLAQLHEAVEREFINLNQEEQKISSMATIIENNFIHRIKELKNE